MVVSLSEIKSVQVPPFPAESPGNQTFSNYILFGTSIGLAALTIYFNSLSIWLIAYLSVLYVPFVFITYIMIHCRIAKPVNSTVKLPGKKIEEYMTIVDSSLSQYSGHNKIPMETFFEAYFDGKIDLKGDCLEIFENRYDWASFEITINQGIFFLTQFLPEMLWHSKKQDLDQVREHYDRGNDFYAAFLGTPMVYTSGIISDVTKKETIEELQENKLKLVSEKLRLKEGETLLDLGCGWGTLACYAAKNYGVRSTGVTLAKEQHKFGMERAKEYGVADKVEIICSDAREIPRKKYSKISCLEMAEHVGVRHFQNFMLQIREMLDDDGLYLMQVAGLRATWQYEDFVWGLFMNKHVFPGADASTPLNWYINELEKAGFEVMSIDTIGCHYSATLWRWYELWMSNRAEIEAKYGKKWFRKWEVFLAWSTIISRQGSATCYQILAHKNVNKFNRFTLVDGKRLIA